MMLMALLKKSMSTNQIRIEAGMILIIFPALIQNSFEMNEIFLIIKEKTSIFIYKRILIKETLKLK